MKPETFDTVTASIGFADDVGTLRLSGSAEGGAMEALSAWLTQVHDEAISKGVTRVDVDLSNLEFMNSSCMKVLVSWIARLDEGDPSGQYRVRLLSNSAHGWQRRSLPALAAIAPSHVSVEVLE